MSKKNLYREGVEQAPGGYTGYVNRLISKGFFDLNTDDTVFPRSEHIVGDYALIDKWCEENLKGEFCIGANTSVFELKEDLVKFGLTWI